MHNLKRSPIVRLLNALQPCIVDIGARGGLGEDLLAIAWACSVYGLNRSLQKLIDCGNKRPTLEESVRVLPYAVDAFSGRSTLYLPYSEQYASLLRHNPDMVEGFGYEDVHIVRKRIPVDTVTVHALRESGELSSADYMKIDIEGAELDVLKAGHSILKDCSALKIECSFLPQRTSEPLMWDVVPFMVDAGFDVVDIHDIHRWRRRPLPAHPYIMKFEMPYSHGQLAQCDLIFFKAAGNGD